VNLNIRKQLKRLAVFRMLWDSISIIRRVVNRLGNKRKCYICGKTFSYFTKYRGGSKSKSEFRKKLDGVGSDVDNFGCMYCGCHDRERHLFMFFDELKLWGKMENRKILHFAPERHLAIRISEQAPAEYVRADLDPANSDIRKIDATAIPFGDDTFDFLIANHILEHIPDYRQALSEFYRILNPGGIAILQTPYSKLLRNNFEDEGIDSDELRLFFHGERDHVRTFGEHQFLRSLEEAGFSLQIRKHGDYFDASTAYYYGVPSKEDLIMVTR
jgi:SAM-dependent methyltransferase